eukprot:4355911-Alexandrium_andersonii.AAC.1
MCDTRRARDGGSNAGARDATAPTDATVDDAAAGLLHAAEQFETEDDDGLADDGIIGASEVAVHHDEEDQMLDDNGGEGDAGGGDGTTQPLRQPPEAQTD